MRLLHLLLHLRELFRLPKPLLLGFICLKYELLVCLHGPIIRRPLGAAL